MDGLHPVAPQLTDIQHIGLVDGTDPAPPLGRQGEGHPGDAIDLVIEIGHRVEGPHPPLGLDTALRQSEIDATNQLAHHHQINAADYLRPQAAGAN